MADSSRRAKVQVKRKRLGLDVYGKIEPFVYSTDDAFEAAFKHRMPKIESRLYKPTRKQCYEAALQADRIMSSYPQWIREDKVEHRLQIIKNWMRWQMAVRYEKIKR